MIVGTLISTPTNEKSFKLSNGGINQPAGGVHMNICDKVKVQTTCENISVLYIKSRETEIYELSMEQLWNLLKSCSISEQRALTLAR